MNETYTQVGTDPSWVIAFMPVPGVIVYYFKNRKSTAKPRRFAWLLLPVIWFFTTAIVGMPMEWIIAGACAGMAVATLLTKSYGKGIARYSLAGLCLVLAFAFTQIPRIGDTRIVLQDSQVKFAWIGRNDTVPRKGLRINYIGPNKKEPAVRKCWVQILLGSSTIGDRMDSSGETPLQSALPTGRTSSRPPRVPIRFVEDSVSPGGPSFGPLLLRFVHEPSGPRERS